jgi:hypothetical protein
MSNKMFDVAIQQPSHCFKVMDDIFFKDILLSTEPKENGFSDNCNLVHVRAVAWLTSRGLANEPWPGS